MSNDSKPAFPNVTPDMPIQGGPGLTKREYAAIQIAAGMGAVDESGDLWSAAELAERAVHRADMLLATLETTPAARMESGS